MYKRITSSYELKKLFEEYNRAKYSMDAFSAILNEILPEDYILDIVEICCAIDEYGVDAMQTFDDLISDYAYLIDPDQDMTQQQMVNKIKEALEKEGCYVIYTLRNGNILLLDTRIFRGKTYEQK